MTPDVAADLAARTLAAIDEPGPFRQHFARMHAADRERVASDLAGLRDHTTAGGWCSVHDYWLGCDDAARYADGLRRTAALYGVTP